MTTSHTGLFSLKEGRHLLKKLEKALIKQISHKIHKKYCTDIWKEPITYKYYIEKQESKTCEIFVNDIVDFKNNKNQPKRRIKSNYKMDLSYDKMLKGFVNTNGVFNDVKFIKWCKCDIETYKFNVSGDECVGNFGEENYQFVNEKGEKL